MIKPHIVIVLSACGGRTIGQYAILRATYFAKNFHVTIVSNIFPDEFPNSVNKVQVSPASYNYLHRFCHVPNEVSFAFAARKAIRNLHASDPISFVLCHSYSLTYIVGQFMKSKYSVPHGMFMHGHIFARPKGTYDSCVTAFYEQLAPRCYSRTDLIFSLSKEQKRMAIAAGAPENKVKLAPNGIQIDHLGINPHDVDGKQFERFSEPITRLLYVGRCTPEKGFHVLVNALEILQNHCQDIQLQVIGGGAMDSHDVNRIIDGPLKNIVFVKPEIPRDQLGKYYLNTDILCVPSIDEPLGNVVLEGIISGCVVIGSNVGGIPDIIENNKTGFLFSVGKAEKLAETINRCISDKEFSRKIAATARSIVELKFGWTNILESMENEISSTIKASKSIKI